MCWGSRGSTDVTAAGCAGQQCTGAFEAAESQSLSLDVLPGLDQQLQALLGSAASSCWQLSAPCAPLAVSSLGTLLSALPGSTQRLPSTSLLAALVSLCSKLGKQSWWRSKTKQGRSCCQPGLDLRDSTSKAKLSPCRSSLRCAAQILALAFPSLKDSHHSAGDGTASIIMAKR